MLEMIDLMALSRLIELEGGSGVLVPLGKR
jgi:hypothetical protein